MGNKQLYGSGKISASIIINCILWSFVYSLIYTFVGAIAIKLISNIIISIMGKTMAAWLITACVSLLVQGFLVALLWKSSIKSAFKNKVVKHSDVPKVMRNIIIFAAILFIGSGISEFVSVNKDVETSVNNQLKYYERLMSYVHNEEQIAQYEIEKAEAIKKVKSELYNALAVMQGGMAIVYVFVMISNKKEILKYAVY